MSFNLSYREDEEVNNARLFHQIDPVRVLQVTIDTLLQYVNSESTSYELAYKLWKMLSLIDDKLRSPTRNRKVNADLMEMCRWILEGWKVFFDLKDGGGVLKPFRDPIGYWPSYYVQLDEKRILMKDFLKEAIPMLAHLMLDNTAPSDPRFYDLMYRLTRPGNGGQFIRIRDVYD